MITVFQSPYLQVLYDENQKAVILTDPTKTTYHTFYTQYLDFESLKKQLTDFAESIYRSKIESAYEYVIQVYQDVIPTLTPNEFALYFQTMDQTYLDNYINFLNTLRGPIKTIRPIIDCERGAYYMRLFSDSMAFASWFYNLFGLAPLHLAHLEIPKETKIQACIYVYLNAFFNPILDKILTELKKYV